MRIIPLWSTTYHMVIVLSVAPPHIAFGQPAEPTASLDAGLKVLSEAYGFSVEVADRPSRTPRLHYEAAPAGLAREYLDSLRGELGRYPVEFVKAAGIRRIVLCGRLFQPSTKGSPVAVADPIERVLFLDIGDRPEGRHSILRKAVIHHEFFHIMDYSILGALEKGYYSDTAWKRLNEAGFLYFIEGGPEAKGSDPRTPVPGFITGYAKYSPGEDKAELFSWLVVLPEIVERRCREDARLAAKVKHLKMYLRRSCPSLDDAAWERLRRGGDRVRS